MKFYFCENCGKRITEADLAVGLGKNKKLKGVYCKNCSEGVMTMETAPISDDAARRLLSSGGKARSGSPGAGPASMDVKWFFCEKCNKRITEADLAVGLGKDKKLKGVYCKNCSEGVMTMEFSAITAEQAAEIVRKTFHARASGQRADPIAIKKRGQRKSSRLGRPASPAGAGEGHSFEKSRRLTTASSPNALFAGIVVTVAVLSVSLLFLVSGTSKRPAARKKIRSKPERQSNLKSNATPPSVASTRLHTSVHIAQPASEPEHVIPPEDGKSEEAFDGLRRTLKALKKGNKPARIAAIERFLKEHGASILGARARAMLAELKRSESAPPPASTGKAELNPGSVAGRPQAGTQSSLIKGLVLYLKLDETGGTAAADASGKGHNGTLKGGPVWAAGKIGGALRFDGKDDWVIVENVPVNTAPGAQNTIAFWMKWDGGDGKYGQMPVWTFSLALYIHRGSIGFNTGESNILGFSSTGLAGRWVHVAAIFFNGIPAPSSSKIYINGVEQSLNNRMGATTKTVTASPLIHLSGNGEHYQFGGMLDEVRVYNRALTPQEIQTLAQNPEPGQLQAETQGPPDSNPAALALVKKMSAEAHYAAFLDEYIGLLRKRDAKGAEKLLGEAEKNSILASYKPDFEKHRKAILWLNDMTAAFDRGLRKLGEWAHFELRLKRGAPLRVGKKAEFQVKEIKDGRLHLQSKGMTLDIPVSNLHEITLARIVDAGLGKNGRGHACRAFSKWLTFRAAANHVSAGDVRAAIKTARKEGASGEDLAYIQNLLELSSRDAKEEARPHRNAKEEAAQRAWAKAVSLAKARQWTRLPLILRTFKQLYGKTKFGVDKKKEFAALSEEAKMRTAAMPTRGLVGYWTFDEGQGKKVRDFSGKNHAGRLIGDVKRVPGVRGGALEFSGDGQYVRIGTHNDFNFNNQSFSISVWVKVLDGRNIVAKGNDSWRGWYLDSSYWVFGDRDGPRFRVNTGYEWKPKDPHWVQLAVTVDAKARKAVGYLNGKQTESKDIGNDPDLGNLNEGPLLFGSRSHGIKPYYKGQLDEVRIYRRTLSPREIRLLYESAKP